MATKTAPATKIDPPIGVAFDANTGKAVTLGMDVYPAGWTVYDGYLLNNSNNGNKIFGKGCVNCHQQIHGSNAPSGVAFGR